MTFGFTSAHSHFDYEEGSAADLTRQNLLIRISDAIIRVRRKHPLRVSIDGVDGAGKTTLADDLTPYIEMHGVPVIRASIDSFHQPRAVRYRRGIDSPEGFYYDSFDLKTLRVGLMIRLVREATVDIAPEPLTGEPTHRFRSQSVKRRRTQSYCSTAFSHSAQSWPTRGTFAFFYRLNLLRRCGDLWSETLRLVSPIGNQNSLLGSLCGRTKNISFRRRPDAKRRRIS